MEISAPFEVEVEEADTWKQDGWHWYCSVLTVEINSLSGVTPLPQPNALALIKTSSSNTNILQLFLETVVVI